MCPSPYSNDEIYEYAKANNTIPPLSTGQIPVATTFIVPPVNGYPVTPVMYPTYPPPPPPPSPAMIQQQKMMAVQKGYINGAASALAVCCCLQLLCCLL